MIEVPTHCANCEEEKPLSRDFLWPVAFVCGAASQFYPGLWDKDFCEDCLPYAKEAMKEGVWEDLPIQVEARCFMADVCYGVACDECKDSMERRECSCRAWDVYDMVIYTIMREMKWAILSLKEDENR